ncbi:MAG: lamin tail domain-containing protein [Desulfuromonadales bacterium]|nr:lamin tail domain-containing protein [Desulfuromonadales bacterium]
MKMKKVLAAFVMVAALAGAGSANAALYISQIYGGGGSGQTSVTYKYDYIELYNSGTTAIDLSSYSIQYASATGNFASNLMHSLSGTIGANKYYLIQESTAALGGSPGTAGAELPVTANLLGKLNLSGTAGKVALVSSSTVVPGTGSTGGYVDLIGYGTSANFNNNKPTTANLSLTTAVFQSNNGTLTTGATSLHQQIDYNSTPTPVPAAAWLLGSGLLGLVGIRRRKV